MNRLRVGTFHASENLGREDGLSERGSRLARRVMSCIPAEDTPIIATSHRVRKVEPPRSFFRADVGPTTQDGQARPSEENHENGQAARDPYQLRAAPGVSSSEGVRGSHR